MSESFNGAGSPSGARPDPASGEVMRAALARQLDGTATPDPVQRPPFIPDHTLLRRIGGGAYGEVWLARNTLGTLRAVKVVYRSRFRDDRPYEREFHGILKYEPISRTHAGLVQVLHVGRNDQTRCFYYVMELADAVGEETQAPKPGNQWTSAQPVPHALEMSAKEAAYSPRTLRSELARRQRLPSTEAAQLVLRLADALAHLHTHGLVHRDIKPSNVIFVDGQPKLADIGLVTDVGSSLSFVGTEGFIPPEGPGTARADLYGLGKLLYELATGRDRMDFPQLPPLPRASPPPASGAGVEVTFTQSEAENEALLELNEVMTRACAPEPAGRYATATELQADLNLFLGGRSLRRMRNIERHLGRLKRIASVACALVVLAGGVIWFAKNEERHANERATQALERARAESALRQRAEAAERATEQQLYNALLEQARATVRSGELGHRVRALETLQRAAALNNTAELRREALSALALPDLRLQRTLPLDPEVTLWEPDPSFERIALCRGQGPIEIRRASDQHLISTLPASTNLQVYFGIWSPDGRHLAVKRDYSAEGHRMDLEIWDVEAARRLLLLRDAAWNAVSFHPRHPQILVGQSNGDADLWDLKEGQVIRRFKLPLMPLSLRFAPDGSRFAAACIADTGFKVSVYDAHHAKLLASSDFPDWIGTVTWHPAGDWLAVTDHTGAIHRMDAASGLTHELGKHKAQAATAVFSPDGAYLITGGWERELIGWDVTGMRRAFDIPVDGYAARISTDGRQVVLVTRSALLWLAFESPTGVRDFPESQGWRLRHAALSQDGRWLAASANTGMGVWDMSGGGPGAFDEKAYNAIPHFMPGGRELFASRTEHDDECGFHWRIEPPLHADEPPTLVRLPLSGSEGLTSLALSANRVVVTGSKGSQILSPAAFEADPNLWRQTHSGISGGSQDGQWLGIFRPYTASLYIHRLPGLERMAKLTHPASISEFMFSPWGDEVAVCSAKGVELWNTATWHPTRFLTDFTSCLYTPERGTCWFMKDLRSAGLYDSRTLDPLLLLPKDMRLLCLSPDGKRLALSVGTQRLQVWDLIELQAQLREYGLDWSSASP